MGGKRLLSVYELQTLLTLWQQCKNSTRIRLQLQSSYSCRILWKINGSVSLVVMTSKLSLAKDMIIESIIGQLLFCFPSIHPSSYAIQVHEGLEINPADRLRGHEIPWTGIQGISWRTQRQTSIHAHNEDQENPNQWTGNIVHSVWYGNVRFGLFSVPDNPDGTFKPFCFFRVDWPLEDFF